MMKSSHLPTHPVLIYGSSNPSSIITKHITQRRTPALLRPEAPARAGLRLTQRDQEIVHAVYTHRALTAPQIHRLFFQGEIGQRETTVSSRCQYRLKLLFQHGYLFRDTPPTRYNEGRKPLVYFLDRAAIPLLTKRYNLTRDSIDWHPSHNDVTWPFLAHLLHTNDVRIAVTLACRHQHVQLHVWHDERQLKAREMKDYVVLPVRDGRRRRVAVVPDGYFHLTDARYHYHQFLEVDLGTETVGGWGSGANRKTFAQKIAAYLAYYQSGQYSRRYGTRAIRVLITTTTAARMQNLWTMTNQLAGRNRDLFWFTTLDQVNAETMLTAPIWRVGEREHALPLLDAPAHPRSANHASSSLGAMQPALPTFDARHNWHDL